MSFQGKKHTEKTKKLMSLNHRRFQSEESKKKIGLAHIGKKQSKSTIEKRIRKIKNNGRYQKKKKIIIQEFLNGKSCSQISLDIGCSSNTIIRILNVEGINTSIKGRKMSEEHKRKLSENAKNNANYGMKGKIMSSETKIKISLANSGRKREDLKKRNKEINFIKKRIKGMNLKPNKPERIIESIIKKNNLPFNYVGDGKVIIKGFNPDFLSKNPKHIIEVFGDYWHNLPKVKERDKRRVKAYNDYGYKTLIIWEHELNYPKNVLSKINNFLSLGGSN